MTSIYKTGLDYLALNWTRVDDRMEWARLDWNGLEWAELG